MIYWPLSVIATSPLAPPAYAEEIRQIAVYMPSRGAYHAAADIARHTPAVAAPNLVVIETAGGPPRLAYTGPPAGDEWLKLERGCIMENDGVMFILINGMH